MRRPTNHLGVVIAYSRLVKGQAFSPEEVIAWGNELGITFHDARSWGGVFIQAHQGGWIKPSKEMFRRASSNGSKRPGWIGV